MPGTASQAFLYGHGVFTTIAIVDGSPFLWDKHWRRLTANAAKLEIDLSEFSEANVFEALTREIESKNLKTGRVRITFADESGSEIWSQGGEKKTSLSIITADRRKVRKRVKLTVSSHRVNTTSPLAGIKSTNYLDHLLSHEAARKSGFDEAIRLNERAEVASACMANFFWMMDGKLYTPSLKTGCLAGTTREFVLENVDCEEVEADVNELNSAESVFLTSAGIGIVAVSELNGRKLSTDHSKLFTEEIRSVFFSG